MSLDTARLESVVLGLRDVTVAVSGGVDSTTLASYAHRTLGRARVRVVHAVSPAVPPQATTRVQLWAARERWRLELVDAGEFQDEDYRKNPRTRCYVCKSHLYRALDGRGAIVVSGTNRDDLDDFRPGLRAAAEHGVRHPYVEAGLGKADVRALARSLGLNELAGLPSSPCLSSRVETGIRIEPSDLSRIAKLEAWLQGTLAPRTVRCRLRSSGLVVELDSETLAGLEGRHAQLVAELVALCPELQERHIDIAPYRRGSAFVHTEEESAR